MVAQKGGPDPLDRGLVTVSSRQRLLPILTKARSLQKYRGSVRLVADKLFVNNVKYTAETMNTLPSDLNPVLSSTQTKNNVTAFFTVVTTVELPPLSVCGGRPAVQSSAWSSTTKPVKQRSTIGQRPKTRFCRQTPLLYR